MNEDIAGRESSSLVASVLISGIVGAGLALLLTPKSGRDLRQDLRRYSSKAGEQAAETAETAGEKAKEIYQESTASAAQSLESAKAAMAGQQQEIAESAEKESSLVVPILVSGVIGAAVALLFAPKPGSEVMEDIKDLASTAFEKSKGWYEQGTEAVKDAVAKGKEAAAESKEQMKPAA